MRETQAHASTHVSLTRLETSIVGLLALFYVLFYPPFAHDSKHTHAQPAFKPFLWTRNRKPESE